ncbi:MAG: carbohydrate-binding family 9-like protein [Candidatus Krumholzibacteriota bacterium]|nr:carbohydrate-binding family 9-like protein [Candidatus Krumholzibacteriota bacterium]
MEVIVIMTYIDRQEKQVSNLLSAVIFFGIICAMLASSGCGGVEEQTGQKRISDEEFLSPSIEYSPKRYLCRKTEMPVVIDGKIDDGPWMEPWVEWSHYFVNITGEEKPAPRFRTRAKMMWDDDYFYIAAYMIENSVWASVTERDGQIYQDNDLEIFIDPDGDSHEYFEIGINAYGTVRDVFLVKPYRDGGPAIASWDIKGLKSAVSVDGTINDPENQDRGWTVEIAIPWEVLGESAHKKVPPDEGDIWAINISRGEYDVKIEDGIYVKATDPETGRPEPEYLSVWSQQGIANMHYPEMWGLVKFSNMTRFIGADSFKPGPDEQARWLLRRIYYREREHFLRYGAYTEDLSRLGIERTDIFSYIWPPVILVTAYDFEACMSTEDSRTRLVIVSDGRLTLYEQ